MNTWLDPQFESRGRIFTVTDVNVKFKGQRQAGEPGAAQTTGFKPWLHNHTVY